MSCNCGQKDDWVAILDKMPPDGPRLRVDGTANCNTTGYSDVRLEPHEPPGINPRILLLNLRWTAPTGNSGDAVTPHKVHYERRDSSDYDEVVIVNCNSKKVPVKTVH